MTQKHEDWKMGHWERLFLIASYAAMLVLTIAAIRYTVLVLIPA